MRLVRDIHRVRVYSRTQESAQAFATRESERHDIEVEVANSAQAAVDGADIICTVTTAKEPVLEGAWIAPGAHINAVGAFTPTTRELDTEAVAKARLYIDRRESTLAEAGEFIIPQQEGVIDAGHIVGELGEVMLGKAPGRTAAEEITLFKSLGIAIEDLASAHYVLQQAQEKDAGTWVEIGGRHYGST
jgi:ornithine cyclodeaminase